MSLGNGNILRDINQCRQSVDQLMQECQNKDGMFRQMMEQESQNVHVLEQEARNISQFLEQLAQRERQAVRMAEMAFRDNQMSVQRLKQASQLCSEMEMAANHLFSAQTQMGLQNTSQQMQ